MPYFEIEGESIYDRLREPKFHLLLFSDGTAPTDDTLDDLGELIDLHSFPIYPNIAEIFGSSESFCVVLRPDNYIGYIRAGFSAESVSNYIDKISK
jgi:hypothetical protein